MIRQTVLYKFRQSDTHIIHGKQLSHFAIRIVSVLSALGFFVSLLCDDAFSLNIGNVETD